jgi:hypothetical protein
LNSASNAATTAQRELILLLVLLGLALGFIMELVLESLVRRLFVIVLVAAGLWALNNDVGLTRPIPEDNTFSSMEVKKEEVKLEDVQLSRSGYGGYALSGNVVNDSYSWLTTIYFRITLNDCQDSNCRIVGQEDASASVNVPPQQMRAFGSVAISFNDLPTLGPVKRRSWSYTITSLRGRPDTDRQHQANAIDGMAAIPDR